MSDMLTEKVLKRIRRRCQAATPGPWESDNVLNLSLHGKGRRGPIIFAPAPAQIVPGEQWALATLDICGWPLAQILTNASFLANARQDVAALLVEVDRLKTKLGE